LPSALALGKEIQNIKKKKKIFVECQI